MENIFIDLERELLSLGKTSMQDRTVELKKKFPNVYLYAIGGIPLKKEGEHICLLQKEINITSCIDIIKESVGISGVLTYVNKSKLSLMDMGNKCYELKHLWAENWLMLSFLVSAPEKVELSILRDKNFYESWIETNQDGIKTFGITGSIKSFKKFMSHRFDETFDVDTRNFMINLFDKYEFIWNL